MNQIPPTYLKDCGIIWAEIIHTRTQTVDDVGV
jgi:hypothetical protein